MLESLFSPFYILSFRDLISFYGLKFHLHLWPFLCCSPNFQGAFIQQSTQRFFSPAIHLLHSALYSFLLSDFIKWCLCMHLLVSNSNPGVALDLFFPWHPAGAMFCYAYPKDISSLHLLLYSPTSAIFCSSNFCFSSEHDHTGLPICLLLLFLLINS